MDSPEKIIEAAVREQVDRIIVAVGRTPAAIIARETGLSAHTIGNVFNYKHYPSKKTLRILTDRYL